MLKKLFILTLFILPVVNVYAQMSDEQVINLLQDAQQKGMNQQEMVGMLMQKGVSKEQLMRIKEQYNSMGMPVKVDEKSITGRMRTQPEYSNQMKNQKEKKEGMKKLTMIDSLSMEMEKSEYAEEEKTLKIFGHNIFNSKYLTFEPNLNIATPENYILGPGDEVIIDIWGDSEQSQVFQISPDGNVLIERVGPVYLNGITIAEANRRLKNAFAQIYSTIGGNSPTSHITVSLGKVRTIRINVMGEVKVPGTYSLPSLASLFHALYSAGGVNNIGSLRSVKISRNGKEIADIDVYDYLLKGKSDLDIRLHDNDVVIISPYKNLIEVKGKVKRPMIYEMKDEESLTDILKYTGGFTGDAYKKAIRVIRKSGREHQVYNVEEDGYRQFVLVDGDEVTVDSIIDRFENKLEIKGAVYRQGLYSLNEKTRTVKQLIDQAEGVKGDAFLSRAILYREKPDLTLEVISVDVKGILNGEVADIPLMRNDVLYIPSIFDIKEDYTVTIRGAVRIAGTYKYASGMSIEDLVLQAGGLKESASYVKVDVARRIKNTKTTTSGNMLAVNYTLTLKDGFIIEGEKDFTLMPFDEVYIRNSPGYYVQQNVQITGEVLFEGPYALSNKSERLSDIVRKAGGLTPEAYEKGARLIRKMTPDERAKVESLLKLSKQGGRDSIDINSLNIGDSYSVGIELDKALGNPGSEYDLVLQEGDRLEIPQYSNTVKISGGVMFPNTVTYKKNVKLKHYIEQGGGYGNRAKKKKVFIVHMNGTVTKSKPLAKAKVTPGSEVIVPVRPMRNGWGVSEIMGIATSTTSIAALVASIVNSTK